jgi:hypothetical protein
MWHLRLRERWVPALEKLVVVLGKRENSIKISVFLKSLIGNSKM